MARFSNKIKLNARNKKVIERFDYWYDKKRLRYDDVLKKLANEEFFLSEATIMRILKGTGNYAEPKPDYVQVTLFDAIERAEKEAVTGL